MENPLTKQTEEPVINARKTNGVKGFQRTCLLLGVLATAFIQNCLMFDNPSSSGPPTPSEIVKELLFQENWDAAQIEVEQKYDMAQKKEEQKWEIAQKEAEKIWKLALKAEQQAESIGK